MVVWVEKQVKDQRLIPLFSFQLSSISKAITTSEMPVKEKHARRILNKKINRFVLYRQCLVLPSHHNLKGNLFVKHSYLFCVTCII